MRRWLRSVWHWVRPPHVMFWLVDGGPAGEWEVWPPPRSPGRYPYSLFRSVWHARLHRELRSAGSVWVAYRFGGEEVRCRVAGCPEAGVLELAEVIPGPVPAEPPAAADPTRDVGSSDP
jgi:hypothetical protein